MSIIHSIFKRASTVAALLTIAVMLGCSNVALAQEPLKVEVKPQAVYLPGLPLVVQVDVVNTSTEVQEIDVPNASLSNMANVYARLRRPGAKEYLRGYINRDYPARTEPHKRVSLKPGERASVRVNLSAWFNYDLPIGQYLCQATYYTGGGDRSKIASRSLKSEPYLITIAAPTHKNFEVERELYKVMVKFLAAKACFDDGIYRSAHPMFLTVANNYPDTEYRRISNYYLAVTAPQTEEKIEALNRFLEYPSPHLPDLVDEYYRPIGDKNYIHQWLGRLYFESGELDMARETFLKIPQPNTQVQEYLKKIEAAELNLP